MNRQRQKEGKEIRPSWRRTVQVEYKSVIKSNEESN